MEPSLLRSLRAYLQSQQDHLLAQQTEQEWLLGEIAASLEASRTQLKETRQMLASLPQSAAVPPGSTLAAFLPSFVPTFLQRTFSGTLNEQPPPEATRKRAASETEFDEEQEGKSPLPPASDRCEPPVPAATDESPLLPATEPITSAPGGKSRHSTNKGKGKALPAPRPPVVINKARNLHTSGPITHVSQLTTYFNEKNMAVATTGASAHAGCSAPSAVPPAAKRRRVVTVEVDTSTIAGFDAHVDRVRKASGQGNEAGASGSAHARTMSSPGPSFRGL